MSYERYVEKLPPTHFGSNRVLEIGYFGHGDIAMSQWAGDVDAEPEDQDSTKHTCNFAHGSDIVLFAAALGFLRRTNHYNHSNLALSSASGLLLREEPPASRSQNRESYVASLSNGSGFPLFNIDEQGLSALAVHIPNQPGTIDLVGGTGIFECKTLFGSSLAFVGLPAEGSTETVGERAIFLLPDEVVVMTQMICHMALGEYRDDIKHFLNQQVGSDNE